ncbi:MAG: hypothetical protein QNJ72_14330 [Pleurocapsa sp. MO_226.B13]|nr:hypothetical protein [Pleurocapsa sp. MO_226.B13]
MPTKTKKDLEQQFGISDNTVYKTLKSCGLDTSKEDYSEEEIENYFQVAREMLNAGKKYKDVEQYFGLADVEPEKVEEQQHDRANQGSAADAVGMATAEMAVDMVQDAVKQIAPHIPQLVAHTLAEEMRSPEMKDAFQEMRSEIREQRNNNNAGVDFLLNRMNGRNGAKQLTGGSSNTQALPEASAEESEQNSNE